ncbi:MAG: peptidase M28, partial [Acidobacteriia bacterium]|nr:peptidase M28 [Terriglobia bacterium]
MNQTKRAVSFVTTTLAMGISIGALAAQGRPVTAEDEAAGKAWWAHIQALADNKMEGRLTGSEGYLRAAKYVVSQFDSARLQPAGVNGYYQPVKFDVTRIVPEKSSLALLRNGTKEPLSVGPDAVLTARGNQPKTVTAPLVFLGYGLHLPEAKYDDFDSPEVPFSSLKGKIVVVVNGGPADLPAALKSFARTQPLQQALADAGALGTITIPTPKSMDFPWDRVMGNSS